MQITKWEPFKDVDKFFDERFFQPLYVLPRSGSDVTVDVYEEKGDIFAKLNLPGLSSEDLDISLKEDMLTISGKRKEEKEIEKKKYYSKEIMRESFSRTISLPKAVDASKAEATYIDGELLVKMPILPNAKDKNIKIKIKNNKGLY